MTLTRPPLESIGMNSGGVPKRRSARLSADSVEENEPPVKRSKVNGVDAHKATGQGDDGDAGATSKRKRAGKPQNTGRAMRSTRHHVLS